MRSAWRAALASLSRLAASAKRLMADGDESRELVFSFVKTWREMKVHFRGSMGSPDWTSPGWPGTRCSWPCCWKQLPSFQSQQQHYQRQGQVWLVPSWPSKSSCPQSWPDSLLNGDKKVIRNFPYRWHPFCFTCSRCGLKTTKSKCCWVHLLRHLVVVVLHINLHLLHVHLWSGAAVVTSSLQECQTSNENIAIPLTFEAMYAMCIC